jgi:hypothetical protein
MSKGSQKAQVCSLNPHFERVHGKNCLRARCELISQQTEDKKKLIEFYRGAKKVRGCASVRYIMMTLVFLTSTNLIFTRYSCSCQPLIQQDDVSICMTVRMMAGAKERGSEGKCLGFVELAE